MSWATCEVGSLSCLLSVPFILIGYPSSNQQPGSAEGQSKSCSGQGLRQPIKSGGLVFLSINSVLVVGILVLVNSEVVVHLSETVSTIAMHKN